MRITIAAKELKRALDTVMPAIPSKANIPILSHVHMSSGDDGLTLTGMNTEIGIRHIIEPTGTDDHGAAVIPARLLSDAISGMSGEISIATDGSRIILQGAGTTMRIPSMNPDEYPRFPAAPDGSEQISVDAAAFATAAAGVRFAVATDETRPQFTGVLMQCEDDVTHMVATDGHVRAAWQPLHVDGKLPEIIIPAVAVDIITRLFTGPITIITDGRLIEVKSADGRLVLCSRLIEGPFAKWRRIIPTDHQVEIDVPRSAFLAGLSQVMVVVKNDIQKRVTVSLSGGVLSLQGCSPVSGDAMVSLDVDSDAEMKFAGSVPEMQLAVASSDAALLRLKWTAELSPFCIDNGYVQSPMHLPT